ncbi:MAG: chromate resistance protein [Actinomycetota bacterium]|nr:chromate resistance protein [Actinomycetota bacterium]
MIRRRIDPDAVFRSFRDVAEIPEGAELFDVAGTRLSHRGEYGLEDPVLREISEVVHDADLTRHTAAIFDGLHAYMRRETL